MNLWVEYKKLTYANISMRVYQLCKKMHEVYQGGWFLMKLRHEFGPIHVHLMCTSPFPSLDM